MSLGINLHLNAHAVNKKMLIYEGLRKMLHWRVHEVQIN